MNYKWARDFALELIHQYSIAGSEIEPSYNNQDDYLHRIPKLVDDAQMYIATTTARIREVVHLEELPRTERGGWVLYTLPSNFWQMYGGGLIRFDGPDMQRYHRYKLFGKRQLAIPKEVDGLLSLEYYRYPTSVGPEPTDKTLLDNSEEAQLAVPYYVAAHLVMQDNAFAYSALFNEFEAKLARLAELPQAELTVVEDAYSPAEWEYDS